MDETQKEYEIAFLLRDEAVLRSVLDAMRGVGAEINFESPLNRVPLAYPVCKEAAAFFGWFIFSSAPENVKSINAVLKLNRDVLRFLIITPPLVKKTRRQIPAKPRQTNTFTEERQGGHLSNEDLEKKIEEILK